MADGVQTITKIMEDAKITWDQFIAKPKAQASVLVATLAIVVGVDLMSFKGDIMHFMFRWVVTQLYTCLHLFQAPLSIDAEVAFQSIVLLAIMTLVTRVTLPYALDYLVNHKIFRSRPSLRAFASQLLLPMLQDKSLPVLVTLFAPRIFESFLIKPSTEKVDWRNWKMAVDTMDNGLMTLIAALLSLTVALRVLQPSTRGVNIIIIFSDLVNGICYIYGGFLHRAFSYSGCFLHLLLLFPLLPLAIGFMCTVFIDWAVGLLTRHDPVGKLALPLAKVASATFSATMAKYCPNYVVLVLGDSTRVQDVLRKLGNLTLHFALSCLVTLWAVQAGPAVADTIIAVESSPQLPGFPGVNNTPMALYELDGSRVVSATILVALVVALVLLLIGVSLQGVYVLNAAGFSNVEFHKLRFSGFVMESAQEEHHDAGHLQKLLTIVHTALKDPASFLSQLRLLREEIDAEAAIYGLADAFLKSYASGSSASTLSKLSDRIMRKQMKFTTEMHLPLKSGVRNATGVLDPVELIISQVEQPEPAPVGILAQLRRFVFGPRPLLNVTVAKVETSPLVFSLSDTATQAAYVSGKVTITVLGCLLMPILQILETLERDPTKVNNIAALTDEALAGYNVDVVWKRGTTNITTVSGSPLSRWTHRLFSSIFGRFQAPLLQWRTSRADAASPAFQLDTTMLAIQNNPAWEQLMDQLPKIAVKAFDENLRQEGLNVSELKEIVEMEKEFVSIMDHLVAAINVRRDPHQQAVPAHAVSVIQAAARRDEPLNVGPSLAHSSRGNILCLAGSKLISIKLKGLEIVKRAPESQRAALAAMLFERFKSAATSLAFLLFRIAMSSIDDMIALKDTTPLDVRTATKFAARDVLLLGLVFAQVCYHLMPSRKLPSSTVHSAAAADTQTSAVPSQVVARTSELTEARAVARLPEYSAQPQVDEIKPGPTVAQTTFTQQLDGTTVPEPAVAADANGTTTSQAVADVQVNRADDGFRQASWESQDPAPLQPEST